MLEKYEKDFDENEFMRSFMERKQISTKKQALAELRKLIKKEGYYQTKIKEALKKRYPDAFVAKISQGAYSQAGIPDVMFIKDGHYFGFEVKRPVVGADGRIHGKLPKSAGQDAQSRSGHSDSDGRHYGFKNDRCAERTEAASTAADQSNGGTFWSHDATGSAEPARGRQRDRERRR